MKTLKFWKRVALTIFTTLAVEANAAAKTDLDTLMQRPLIVGASVSADWASKSPGKLLALRYTDESQIKTIAFGGKSGSFVLKKVAEETLRDRSIIIGLDLFFWDATLRSPDESLREMKRLLQLAKANEIPIVLGEVPMLLPGMQPQAALINRELNKACEIYDKCTVLPFTGLLMQVLSQGALDYKGKRYTLKELVPDGLHIGPIASAYIADTLQETLTRAYGG